MKTFAEKIRESRSFLDMSQEELAQKLEVISISLTSAGPKSPHTVIQRWYEGIFF